MRQEILCVVGTDKASFDIEAPADGVLLKTLYNEGSDVQVRPVEGVRRVISKHLHTSLCQPQLSIPLTLLP